MTDPADYIDLVTGGEGGLTVEEAKAIADGVLGRTSDLADRVLGVPPRRTREDREAEAGGNVKALAESIARGY